jgi:hypothetical protein
MCYVSCEIRYPRLARGVISDISFLKWTTSGKGTIQRSNVSSTGIFLETSKIRSYYRSRENGDQVFLQYCYRETGRRG